MQLTGHICIVVLYIATYITMGHSSQIPEHQQESSFVNEVLRNLPTVECDMIVVSTSPLLGEIFLHVTNNLEYIMRSLRILDKMLFSQRLQGVFSSFPTWNCCIAHGMKKNLLVTSLLCHVLLLSLRLIDFPEECNL